ncbi:MAG: GIY-YIG nuclease family protein [Bacilli bacterium]|nr:GIY-YIG nuclease family protein [Bacilli bacterium]
MKRLEITKEYLYEQYVIKERSSVDIAKECNCSYSTITRKLKGFGFNIRTNTESKLSKNIDKLMNYNWMFKQYITNNRPLSSIAKELKCSDKTIANYLRILNISLKTVSESKKDIFKYTIDELHYEALKYNFAKEFAIGSYPQYQSARSRGILKNICSHMGRKNIGFDINKSGLLYYIKIYSECLIVYKIGITNYNTKNRIQTMGLNKKFNTKILKEIYFENGANALSFESEYKKQFKEFQYKGEPIMNNGNTELFTKDVLGLDMADE